MVAGGKTRETRADLFLMNVQRIKRYSAINKGRDIERYAVEYRDRYLWYDQNELHRPAFPELFENEKLCFKKKLPASEVLSGHLTAIIIIQKIQSLM